MSARRKKKRPSRQKKGTAGSRIPVAERRLAQVRAAHKQLVQDRESYKRQLTQRAEPRYFANRDRLILAAVPIRQKLDETIGVGVQKGASDQALIDGLVLVRSLLDRALEEEGLGIIPVLGLPYTPEVSVAVASRQVDEPARHGLVLEEVEGGLRIGSHIVRPASVVVGVHEAGPAIESLPAVAETVLASGAPATEAPGSEAEASEPEGDTAAEPGKLLADLAEAMRGAESGDAVVAPDVVAEPEPAPVELAHAGEEAPEPAVAAESGELPAEAPPDPATVEDLGPAVPEAEAGDSPWEGSDEAAAGQPAEADVGHRAPEGPPATEEAAPAAEEASPAAEEASPAAEEASPVAEEAAPATEEAARASEAWEAVEVGSLDGDPASEQPSDAPPAASAEAQEPPVASTPSEPSRPVVEAPIPQPEPTSEPERVEGPEEIPAELLLPPYPPAASGAPQLAVEPDLAAEDPDLEALMVRMSGETGVATSSSEPRGEARPGHRSAVRLALPVAAAVLLAGTAYLALRVTPPTAVPESPAAGQPPGPGAAPRVERPSEVPAGDPADFGERGWQEGDVGTTPPERIDAAPPRPSPSKAPPAADADASVTVAPDSVVHEQPGPSGSGSLEEPRASEPASGPPPPEVSEVETSSPSVADELVQAEAVPEPAERSFVVSRTVVRPGMASAGFEAGRVARKRDYSGRIELEITPSSPRPGDRYSAKVYLTNNGTQEFEIERVTFITVVNGVEEGHDIPLSEEVAPQKRTFLEDVSGLWREDTSDWQLEVLVTTSRGDTFRCRVTRE